MKHHWSRTIWKQVGVPRKLSLDRLSTFHYGLCTIWNNECHISWLVSQVLVRHFISRRKQSDLCTPSSPSWNSTSTNPPSGYWTFHAVTWRGCIASSRAEMTSNTPESTSFQTWSPVIARTTRTHSGRSWIKTWWPHQSTVTTSSWADTCCSISSSGDVQKLLMKFSYSGI